MTCALDFISRLGCWFRRKLMARLQMVMYQLPSSVTVIPNDKEDVEKEELRKAVESIDNMLYV